MATTTLTLSCGNQKTTFKVNLSGENIRKTLSHNFLGNKNSKQLFNFSQKEYKTQDKSLYAILCQALNSLKAVGGQSSVIDDEDFEKGTMSDEGCKDNKWHCDSCEDIEELNYHTGNNFFTIV